MLTHLTLRSQPGRSLTLYALWLAGCTAPQSVTDTAAQRKMLALLMPSRIEIVEPFTRVRSFDNDAEPDGIELLIQAVNSLDNPGLMIAGDIRVELFEFIAASADNKGRRLEHWDISVSTEAHQRTYWNQVTQMYEFRLELDPAAIPPAKKYLLSVTYNSPLGEHHQDECIVRYRPVTGPLGAAAEPDRETATLSLN